jgi:hypothetical protein
VTSAVLSKQGRDLGGLTLVGYRLDASGTVLLCGEQEYLVGDLDADEQEWEWHVVLENLQTVECEYFDGKKWLHEWNSHETRALPLAARISVVLESEGGRSVAFVSAARIACQRHQIDEAAVQMTAAQGFLAEKKG